MKIIYLTNIILPQIALKENSKISVYGGWLQEVVNNLLKKDYELFYIFLNGNECKGKIENLYYEGFLNSDIEYNHKLYEKFYQIVNSFSPDIIHIWGTEYAHSKIMLDACKTTRLLEKTVVSIQGLISEYSKVYFADLPLKVVQSKTIKEIINNNNIQTQQKIFELRGINEIETIKHSKQVIGRTDWDYNCVTKIAQSVKYYKCNENLREVFYSGFWEYDNCVKHSIYVSQASYPIKGFHKLLVALKILKIYYPDIMVNIGGRSLAYRNITDYFKKDSYQKYINKLIKKYKLEKHINWLGNINAEDVKKQLLKANVFVSPSAIENSSNSIGEAMLIGCPVVAANTGGTSSMLVHDIEGLLYDFSNINELVGSIKNIFDNIDIAKKISMFARIKANKTHNIEENNNTLIDIYKNMIQNIKG